MTLKERIIALKNKQALPIQVWNPVEGDIIAGVYLRKRDIDAPYNPTQILLEDELGITTAVWCNKFIDQKLTELKAEPGDILAITYQGKAPNARGVAYNVYSIQIDKVTQE